MQIIVALDTQERKKLSHLLRELHDFHPFYKVGMELFYTDPNIVNVLKAEGHKVFLDLKLHDIPNTVEKALTTLKRFSPDIINVHALGGKEMMTKAAKVFQGTKTKIIAVTQLTSTDEASMQNDLKINITLNESVLALATLARESGMHGVVCSPLEVTMIKEKLGVDFLTVTPGIRLDQNIQDQKRVTTPIDAKNMGTDYIVVGRPITEALSPSAVYAQILKDIQ